ncbi:MAG: hypothetical protein WD181_05395 [Solirubrobacterales bacterium]
MKLEGGRDQALAGALRVRIRSKVRCLALVVFSLAIPAISNVSPASAALPTCEGRHPKTTLFSNQGRLESVIAGNGGRLFFAGVAPAPVGEPPASRLYRVDRPGAPVAVLLQGPANAGGLAWSERRLLWGYGNGLANGSVGDTSPTAGLLSVDPVTGNSFVVSSTLGMANGIARGPDGTIFASNSLALKLDRITPSGSTFITLNGFASLDSANGLAVSRSGKYIFAAQTFVTPSRISLIEVGNPGRITAYFTSPEASMVVFDGLTRDNRGNLYVAALGLGQIWKINPERKACVLASGLTNPSSVAVGTAPKGFGQGSLFVVGFGGEVTEVKNALTATVPD